MLPGDQAADLKVLSPDEEYRRDVNEAHKRYLERLQEADKLMSRVTVEEFTNALLSGEDPIPGTSAYQRLAGLELEYSLRLAAVRLAMRQMSTAL
ncbi:MAG: hypothetical protein QXS68_06125 [Candidatus Methanomethylicaceae archaeon]